jgi:hypothetical protein
MQLIESKSLLAKLMATENLIVEHRNVKTASFDTEKRVLTIPIMEKNVSPDLEDMFIGHEVGHALYTPQSLLQEAHEKRIHRTVVNVVEDARIERKIKTKYPGIRKCFVKGYRELIEKDFFGTAGTDLNDLNFIDRLNLYTKGGAAQGIKFINQDEKSLLAKVESIDSIDDVIPLSIEIINYLKKEQEERRKNAPEEDSGEYELDDDGEFEFDDFNDMSDDFDSDKKGEQSEKTEEKSKDFGEGEETEDVGSEDSLQSSKFDKGASQGGYDFDNLIAQTDEEFHKNTAKLFNDDRNVYYYGDIPKIDLEQCIFPYKTLWKRYRDEVGTIKFDDFVKVRNDSKKVVSYLAKEFELRKNAEQLKRASVARTGELNMSKIYAYQLMDDIFKKISVVPDGKSHGLVMFLDWSGSMTNHLENTIIQLINLSLFCRKVNIPFEVYAFSSQYYGDDYMTGIQYSQPYRQPAAAGEIRLTEFKLLNILSGKMSAPEYTYACAALLRTCSRRFTPNWFHLGGTPLNEAIIAAMTAVPEFQKKYKLQVVNTVFLTDGEGHALANVWYNTRNRHDDSIKFDYDRRNNDTMQMGNVLVIRDPVTKHQVMCDEIYNGRKMTSAYMKMLKLKTNCNIVGFYVLAGRELSRVSREFFPKVDPTVIREKFRKEKYLIVTNSGYDEYYLLRAEGLDIESGATFEVKENATTRGLVSAFSKYANKRLSNRVVLNRFIGMIA